MNTPFRWMTIVGLFAFAGVNAARAQDDRDAHFRGEHLSGLINDFTTPAFGAWVVHGVWSLDMERGEQAANFTAALTMERSDLFFVATPAADANNLAARNAHTHHVSVVHGTVTPIPGGFRVTSLASQTTVTGNGASALFETDPPSSVVQIDVTGGSLVSLSNITITFGGAATKHFGSNPLAGVVKTTK